MPQYKKRKVNRFKNAVRPRKKHRAAAAADENIEMTHGGKKTSVPREEKSAMRVVKGKKLERQRRVRILLSAAALAAAAAVILHLILPVSIAENIGNLTAVLGSGSYPAELSGGETLNAVSRGLYYYVLTNTEISAFSSSGKKIYSVAHGAENPVLKTSKTRALVFSQGGDEAIIYNLRAKKAAVKTDNDIITACISDSGVYAVATRSESYASVVTVYSKYNKKIYEWFSSSDTVNNVCLSPNGKKLAVSTFGAASGRFSSKINVLEFDSATPKYSESFDGSPIYSIDNLKNYGFSAVFSNSVLFVSWSVYKKSEYKNDYAAAMFRIGDGGACAVFNRESDRTDNRIAVFGAKGQLKSEFEFKGIISDIELSGGHIYCISDTVLRILSEKGETLREADCGFGVQRLAVTGTNRAAVITDNRIDEITLGKRE